MTRQMSSLQMVHERKVIEKVLLTEVAPRVRQDFCTAICAHVTKLNVAAELLYMVYSVFSDEHSSTLKTDFAESFLVHWLQVTTKRFDIRECLWTLAVVHQTLKRPQLHTSSFCSRILVKDRLIFFVLNCVVRVKLIPCQSGVVANDNLLKLLFANTALLLVQKEADAQHALMADLFVIAAAHSKVDDGVWTQKTVLTDAFERFKVTLRFLVVIVMPVPTTSASTVASTATSSLISGFHFSRFL